MEVHVQFSDASKSKVIAVFGVPQDEAIYPNQDTLDSSDERYQAFIDPAPTPAQLAMQALVSGITVSSASTPALNGTYACDALSQADIVAIETSLNAGKGFPGGTATFNYPDAAGALHSFSETNFTSFAAAVRDFVYACKSVIAGQSTALPPSAVTIA